MFGALPEPVQDIVDLTPLLVALAGLCWWVIRTIGGQFSDLRDTLAEWRDEVAAEIRKLDVRVARIEERQRPPDQGDTP